MKQVIDTAISALSLTQAPEASPIFHGDGFFNLMYQSDDPEPSYQILMRLVRDPNYRLDINNLCGVYVAICNKQLAPIAALLAEGQVPSIPPHYRVLSLIRGLELLYEDERERNLALEAFEDHFAGLQISAAKFVNALPQLRTRCAHGISRGRDNPEPFVGYNERNLLSLASLLRSVLAHGLYSKHGLLVMGAEYKLGLE